MRELEDMHLYDSTVYPPLENVPLRFAILRRNEWMAQNADLVIAYVKYSHGGASKAMNFAIKNGKKVINIAEQ